MRIGVAGTCLLAVPLVFAHLAVLLAVAQPLERDAQVVVALELVVGTALLAASLQPAKRENENQRNRTRGCASLILVLDIGVTSAKNKIQYRIESDLKSPILPLQ